MGKKNIIIVIMAIIILAFVIEIMDAEFIVRLNRNTNSELIDYKNVKGVQLDKDVLENIFPEKYLIVYDSEFEVFSRVRDNITKVLDYIQRDYDVISVEKLTGINNEYSSVILIMEDINKLRVVDELMQYVFEGGNAFFAYRLGILSNFNRIYRKLGINEFNEFVDSTGIRLLDNVLIKGEGFEISNSEFIENSSMSLRLSKDSERYAESIDGVELLWKKKHGMGNIVYFNGTMLDSKMNRGFILGSLSLLGDDFIYPIMNSKLSYIDDFPAPFPAGRNEKVSKEFNRTVPRFMKDIWWPNMLELASRYNLIYTGVIIGTYNDEVEEILPGSTDLEVGDFIYYGRELINNNGEMGIHGYNHQPLAAVDLYDKELGYKPWKDIETMVDSINEVNSLGEKVFKDYIYRVYVPPSNILYPEGREAILQSDTDIEIIASLYTIGSDMDPYEQEFEIASDGIIEFPRLTAGYMYTDENVWRVLNGVTAHGIFSHFIHPDDVLDYDRTGDIGWSELLKNYDKFNEAIFNKYRWLRDMTASDGANELIKYVSSELKYENKDEYTKVYINNFYDEMYFILRTEKDIEAVKGCNIEEIDKNIYLVKVREPIFEIEYKR